MRLSGSLPAFALLLLCAAAAQAPAQRKSRPAERPYLHAPAVNEYARHDPDGTTILPNGRFLRPAGRHFAVGRNPHGLQPSPDGRSLFIASEGIGQVVNDWMAERPGISVVQPGGAGQRARRQNGGAAVFSPGGATLYWSAGESGKVYVVDVPERRIRAEVDLNGPSSGRKWQDSFAMDLALSRDGRWLYCADVTNFRVAVVDTARRKVAASLRTGRYPYALALAGSRLYVANIGLFEYRAVPKLRDSARKRGARVPDPRGLTYPAFGFPSREARDGVRAEGRIIAGLGEPNVPESFSVWGIDVSKPAEPRVVSRWKTGLLIGAPSDNGKTVGGSAPNFVAAGRDRLGDAVFVSNGNNDVVERFDPRSGRAVWRRRIVPSPLTARLRGVGPAGMVLSPDRARLYVAESGINAIAVIDSVSGTVLGHIPTAWYPYRLALSADGKRLACICFKGFGNGPRGVSTAPASPFLGMKGVLSVVPVPSAAELRAHTATALACNGMVNRRMDRAQMVSPILPATPGIASKQIKYVVFITKENHTYDTIFDRIPGANDDPTLLRWGLHQQVTQEGQPTLDDAPVMTNHNALAREFTVSDNFYMEPEASGVGHRWLVGVQPNNWCQMTYTLGWNFKANSTAPGRLVSFGSNGSIAPEDYPEAGSMWEHLARNGVGFRNYGEGFEFAGVLEDEDEEPTGAREVVNIPMPKALFHNTCREFPIFNMNIPDQFRADQFMKDFTRLYLKRKQAPPPFINIAICNDHGADPKPAKGYPYRASWMADNDLALGRIVEFLSHTPHWRNMLILVTQDDAGGEPDHVDAQRSVLLAISPWVKRAYVSHRHTTILSMHRTLYQLFGLPPLNMFDALANDFSDCFTTTPDFRAYTCRPVDPRIFDPAKTLDPKDPQYRRARRQTGPVMDDPDEMERLSAAAARAQRPARPQR